MKIVTVINNQSEAGFHLLRLSCVINNLDLVVLVSEPKEFYTNRIKDEVLLNYLQNNVGDDEIFFFTDGYDTLLMCSEAEILGKFYKAGKELLFSAESACWPDKALAGLYPDTISRYKYLNSGGYIGKAGTIKQFLKDDLYFDDNFERSNQYVWTKRFFRHPDIIGLDTACEIFHTFSPEAGEHYWPLEQHENRIGYYRYMKEWFSLNFTIDKGRLYSKITGTWPCQAHFNGPSKSLMNFEIVDMLFSSLPGYNAVQFVEAGVGSPAR
jgi:hypothetical protein